jgi:hypothetical protein
LTAAALGFGAPRLLAGAASKRQRTNKKRKPKPNVYGCLSIGAACKRAAQCCSGICEGKQGKRACRAHDAGTCSQAAPGVCALGNPTLALCNGKTNCYCLRTTAGSNVCFGGYNCEDCRKDADCLALGYPQGTACAPFTGNLGCAGACEETNRMACAVPCGVELPGSIRTPAQGPTSWVRSNAAARLEEE